MYLALRPMSAPSKTFAFIGFCLFLFFVLLPSIQSKPDKNPFGSIQHLVGCHKGQTVKGLQDVKRYLERFGYLNYDIKKGKKSHANDDEFDDLLESAVKTYQRRHHLKVTGSLDAETANQMMKPRCGVPDIVNNGTNHNNHHRKSIHTVGRYEFFRGNPPPRWPADKTHLRYRILSDVQVPGTENLRSICAQAFQRWAQVTHFTFEEVAENSVGAEIEIGFHGSQGRDANDPGFVRPQTLAHAFAPPGGRFHYDTDENWSSNPVAGSTQVDLESVAVHEIGHLLGLDHSDVAEAIMYDTFGYGEIKRDLHDDDIQGIRALYGL